MFNLPIKIYGIIITVLLFPLISFAQASEVACSKSGYTVATINGIFTKEGGPNGDAGAVGNRNSLKRHMGDVAIFNGEPLTFDYLYNPTHGLLDLTDVAIQKTFEGVDMQDPDFLKMLNDASEQVKTQKLLLIAHSQGNFYANNFYEAVTKSGDVSEKTIGVYGVATPASYVAGDGIYRTSDTDTVINRARKVLPGTFLSAHDSINYVDSDDSGKGHGFREIYLEYRGEEIKKEIEKSLGKLSLEPSRSEDTLCINPPKALSTFQKVTRPAVYAADGVLAGGAVALVSINRAVVSVAVGTYHVAVNTALWTYNTTVATAVWSYNTTVTVAVWSYNTTTAVAKFVGNATVAVASTVYNAVAGALSNTAVAGSNSAAVILATQGAQSSQLVSVSNGKAPTIPTPSFVTDQPVVAVPLQTQSLSQSQPQTVFVFEPKVQAGTDMPKLVFVGSFGGGGGGGSTQTLVEQIPVETPPKDTLPEVADTTAPAISILGDNPASVAIYGAYTDAGATALDVVDGVRTVSIASDVNTFQTGNYAVTYTASDSLGNTATSTRVVQVIADASEPIVPILSSDLNKNGIADADESDVVASSTASLLAGEYHFNNLTITNNAVLTAKGDPASSNIFKGVKIVATNLTITSGSSISADGQGYGTGPGSGVGSMAASYGGAGGGNTATSTYGSATKPIDLGSGGGGYTGGGAIRIIATGTLLNDGSISANGSGYRSSGGSIYITANNLKGAGTFITKGGDTSWPNSFAGGGGRIAFHYKQSSFSGSAKALSGVYCFYGCNPAGGLGTVAFFDTANNDFYAGTSWRFQKNDEPLIFNRIIISNGAAAAIDEGVALTANELIINKATTLPLSKGSLLMINKITIDGGTLVSSGGETIIADTLALVNSAVVTVVPMQTLVLSVPSVTIDASSTISATAKGDSKGQGFPPTAYGGGSYGGVGGVNTATSTYGSATKPVDFGSGGGAPHALGGGAIRLIVSDTLVNNGVISADGNTSSSGGSIFVTAKNMTGAGAIHANGGALGGGGYFSGPGGGGRIAVYYQTYALTGKVETLGGCGSYDGWSKTCSENGTAGLFDTINNDLYVGSSWRFQANDGPFNFNRIILSKGATVAVGEGASISANELLSSGASLTSSKGSSLTIPTVAVDGGVVTFSGEETLAINTLTLASNATITVAPERTLSLSIADITLGAGSSISADSKGYGRGAGLGSPPVSSVAGASYGGVGLWNSATSTYGSMREPIEMGSGGNGYNPRGGGAIRLVVSGSLVNNGRISAVGGNTSSGGSIYVTTNALSGVGEFNANGGTVYCPNSCVGAGGGGRIAVYYQTSDFSGTSFALGAKTTYGNGGDGTVVVEQIVATPEAPAPDPAPSLSSAHSIIMFELLVATSTVPGVIDESAHTVGVTVPFGTDIRALAPAITVSPLATSSPASGMTLDFTSPVAYTVVAEDGSTQIYTVTVTLAPDTIPPPDTTPPAIMSYTFNGTEADITADFSTTTPTVNLAFMASENVDWVSIKIEKQGEPSNDKFFYPRDTDCDGTNTCTKTWDGDMSHGTLTDGIYRIKVKIEDMAGNLNLYYKDYLSPHIITVNTVSL